MADIELLDVSFRDGNQSLWGATGLTTGQILQIAPVMDRVGFRALDFTSSTHMGIAVRTHRENPWERIRLTHAAMPRTPLQFIGTGFRFISWESASGEVMRLALWLMAGMLLLVIGSRWFVPPPSAPNMHVQKAAAAAGIVAVGDPWSAACMLEYGYQLWLKP